MDQLLKAPRCDLRGIVGGADRIVVVDTETTGVYPTDRIVEIALITLSLDGAVLDVWDTLVQPERDVGATHIHGITPSMVASAPTFGDVAGDIAVRLEGACVAAHNLPFDARMVCGEFDRVGIDVSIPKGIDTLRATRSRLIDACAQHQIALSDAHRALADATAAANLLLKVRGTCEPGGPTALAAPLPRQGRVFRREDSAPVVVPDPPLIAYLASRLSHRGVEVSVLAYLELVDRCIADLHLDPEERWQLSELARGLGLDEGHIALAHRRFVNELIDAALDDHEITSDEYETLVRAAAALGVDQQVVEQRTRDLRATTSSVSVEAGLRVVFTGDHPRFERSDLVAHAGSLGLEVQSGVTKKTDLLVAADPESNSGKAAKARRYGIPVIGAERFASMRAGDTLEGAGKTVAELKVITCPDCFTTWTVPAASSEQRSKRCTDCATISRSRPDPGATEVGSPLAGSQHQTEQVPPALQSSLPPPLPTPAQFGGGAVPPQELLTCTSCGRVWQRERVRGRKPTRCPACIS